jgi:hypothetical protein
LTILRINRVIHAQILPQQLETIGFHMAALLTIIAHNI